MTRPRLLLALAATAALTFGGVGAASAASAGPAAARTPSAECSGAYFDGNPLLGPKDLPTTGPVGLQLSGYKRTGNQSPQEFLAKYRNDSGWIYPPSPGFVVGPDGKPVEWTMTLGPSQDVDRYGSVYGAYLAPAGTPYDERAIPPTSLESTPAAACDYHDYDVEKSFAVEAGPVASWFDQHGYGVQYYLDGNLVPGAPAKLTVGWLLDNGYLKEITPKI